MTPARAAGVAAPLIYLVAVIGGGAVTPGYDHIGMAISELMAGYVGPWWLYGLLVLYNLLLGLFGAGRRNWALLVSAGLGLALLALPMDVPGTALTDIGVAHIVLAVLASLASMTAIAAGALGAGGRTSLFSWLALLVVLVSGGLAALGTVQGWPIAGLLERLTIGTFLAWVLGFALATA